MKKSKLFGLVLTFASVFTLFGCDKEPVVGPQGPQGEQGEKGEPGVSIVSIEKTSSDGLVDIYTISYSDGTTSSFVVTNGKDGEQGIQGIPGKDGYTPVITISSDGYWVIDGIKTNTKAQGEKGEPGNDGSSLLTGSDAPSEAIGENGDSYINLSTWDYYVKENNSWALIGNIKGDNGQNGDEGNGIVSIELTDSANNKDTYTITFDDGRKTTFTVTNGVDGEQGIPGEDGHTPIIEIGKNGNWYIDGMDTGVSSKGPQGEPGKDGEDGLSAYEIYLKYHPEYEGTEEDWINDLINGNLYENNPSIDLDEYTKQVFVYDIFQINCKTNNVDGKLSWSSSDTKVAQVDDKGTVTAVGVGEVTITASYLKFYDSITFTVYDREENSTEGFQFSKNDDGYSIIGYTGSDSIVNVPSEYNGLPVSRIDNILTPYLVQLNISNSVTSIKKGAFLDCYNLEKIYIPKSVTTIEGNLFSENHSLNAYCEALSKPEGWDDNWSYIGSMYHSRTRIVWGSYFGQNFDFENVNYAICCDVNNNKYIKVVNVVNSYVDSINLLDNYTVEGKIVLVTSIVDFAFSWKSLKEVHLPNTITEIGREAFLGCCSLTSINIPSSVRYIALSAFTFCWEANIYCKANEYLSNWDSNFNYDGGKLIYNSYIEKEFKDGDFTYTVSQKENGVKYITLLEYDGLEENLIIPDSFEVDGQNISLEALTGGIFRANQTLISVKIPNTVTYLGESLFSGCSNLKSVNIPNQAAVIEHWCFVDVALSSIYIPKSVTFINERAIETSNNCTIYCEASSKPSTWNDNWNSNNLTVIWNTTYDEYLEIVS